MKVNATKLLMYKILDENGGSMDAQLLLNEIEKRLPKFLEELQKK